MDNDKMLVTQSEKLFELINKLKLDGNKNYLFPGIELCCSIPTIEAINEIFNFVNYNIVLEIGAGTGIWARLLQLRGVNIIATDKYIDYTFYPIELLNGIDAIQKYHTNVLFLCWPPISSMAYNVLQKFKGDKLIYIGKNDCTASENFFKLLSKEWIKIINLSISDDNGLYIRKL